MSRRKRRTPGEEIVPQYVPSIAARSIAGNLVSTANEVTAWYRLPTQLWSFRSDSQREGLINAIAGQYSELPGRWLHLRVTSRPYPIGAWGLAHVRNSADRPADIPGALSFDDYMVGEQEHLLGSSMAEKEVYLGITVQSRTTVDRLVERAAPLLRRIYPAAVDAELVSLDTELRTLDGIVAGPGLEGRPATPEEMRWLMYRSCTLGLPAPSQAEMPPAGTGDWARTDLAAVTDAAEMVQEPYAPTVEVIGRAGAAARHQRHVIVLSLGLSQPLTIPQVDDPWMARADRLPAGVEWSARIYVRNPGEVSGGLARQANKVKSQYRHYTEDHDLEPPAELQRQLNHINEIEDAVNNEFTGTQARVRSWWRLAVSGRTQQEALANAQTMLNLYKPKIALEHPEAQFAMAREFIPGEPLATAAYERRASVRWAAAAVPTATAEVGDRRGILLGETATNSRRPVAWDPWLSQEVHESSGLTAIVAGLGGGKSFLGGGIVYKTLRTGARWTLLDPSGPLAKLCELPELRPFSRHIDLMRAQPGILNPYRVVAEPRPEQYLSRAQLRQLAPEIQRHHAMGRAAALDRYLSEADRHTYNEDRKIAAATRSRLAMDALMGLLPYSIAQMPQTRIVLLSATRDVPRVPSSHPGMIIDALKRREPDEHSSHAKAVAQFLDEARERIRLLIPDPGADPYAENTTEDYRLTVFSLAGLVLPKEGIAREHWTDQESLGVELLNLAAWLTQRSVYEGPKHTRKGVWIDEAFFLSEAPAGRVLMNRFARDSRKWNVRVLLSSQVPADFLKIQGFVTLLDSVFVGRLDDEHAQADALTLLKIDRGAGYEESLSRLSRRSRGATTALREARQFVFADGAGGVERIRIDFGAEHLAHLRAALDTTPTPDPDSEVTEEAEDGDVDLELAAPGEGAA